MATQPKNSDQRQPPPTISASVDRSLLCFAVGQIVINISWRIPARPPLHRPDWTHWAFVLLVGSFGLWSAWWLSQFGVAHASHPKWLVPIGLFGAQVLLSLLLLEWGIFRPMREAKAAGIRG